MMRSLTTSHTLPGSDAAIGMLERFVRSLLTSKRCILGKGSATCLKEVKQLMSRYCCRRHRGAAAEAGGALIGTAAGKGAAACEAGHACGDRLFQAGSHEGDAPDPGHA